MAPRPTSPRRPVSPVRLSVSPVRRPASPVRRPVYVDISRTLDTYTMTELMAIITALELELPMNGTQADLIRIIKSQL